jgi:hypothetical protein
VPGVLIAAILVADQIGDGLLIRGAGGDPDLLDLPTEPSDFAL